MYEWMRGMRIQVRHLFRRLVFVMLNMFKTTRMLANGKTFYFKINGVPVFIKGAYWIPTGSFPTRTKTSTVRHLLESARAANMNMQRKLQPLGVSCFLTLC